jgi:hypothetical protein
LLSASTKHRARPQRTSGGGQSAAEWCGGALRLSLATSRAGLGGGPRRRHLAACIRRPDRATRRIDCLVRNGFVRTALQGRPVGCGISNGGSKLGPRLTRPEARAARSEQATAPATRAARADLLLRLARRRLGSTCQATQNFGSAPAGRAAASAPAVSPCEAARAPWPVGRPESRSSRAGPVRSLEGGRRSSYERSRCAGRGWAGTICTRAASSERKQRCAAGHQDRGRSRPEGTSPPPSRPAARRQRARGQLPDPVDLSVHGEITERTADARGQQLSVFAGCPRRAARRRRRSSSSSAARYSASPGKPSVAATSSSWL